MKNYTRILLSLVVTCVCVGLAWADATATPLATAAGFDPGQVVNALSSPLGMIVLNWILLHVINWGVLERYGIDESNYVIMTLSWLLGLGLALAGLIAHHTPITLAAVFSSGHLLQATIATTLGSQALHDVLTPPSPTAAKP